MNAHQKAAFNRRFQNWTLAKERLALQAEALGDVCLAIAGPGYRIQTGTDGPQLLGADDPPPEIVEAIERAEQEETP